MKEESLYFSGNMVENGCARSAKTWFDDSD